MEFNIWGECGTLPTAHVSSERTRQQHVEEEEHILKMVKRSPATSTRGPSACAKSRPRGQCHASRILSLVIY